MKVIASLIVITLLALSSVSQEGGDKLVYADFEKMENGRPVSANGGMVQIYTANESTPVQYKGLANATPGAPELIVLKDAPHNHLASFEYSLVGPNQWANVTLEVQGRPMKDGKPVIKKIFAVSDCGEVINKSGALQQVMGAIVDGYGHAMFGKLSFKDGAAEQNNFHNYRMIRMKEIPEIDAHFIDNGIDPTGLGEPALPPTGGAVANAIFKASGIRIKNQPFIEEKLFNPA
jgi:CO/xanthine dehydrogenase Mo-binding subunit